MDRATYLVTGAAGFIGRNFLDILLEQDSEAKIIVLDALTYAGNINSLKPLIERGDIDFVHGDIRDKNCVSTLLAKYSPTYIINFAAETHVDRSVDDPSPFITTNIEGTFNLLECARIQRNEQQKLGEAPTLKKFVQVSTDEVYGDLELSDSPISAPEISELLGREVLLYGEESFTEATPVHPSSPYSASKTSADLLALSYVRSFGMPVVVTRCSNNYGPYQFPEKLIPLAISNLLHGEAIPLYGKGLNVRDWIHVADHCRGVLAAAINGKIGEVYNFGAYNEMQNKDLVASLVKIYTDLTGSCPDEPIRSVSDRPGHDRRYAIDSRKAMTELGWRPIVDPVKGLSDTVQWYLDNRQWVENIVSGEYREYYKKMYSNR